MPRCPDCNTFVPLDAEADPEVDSEAVDDEGVVTCSVRIANACGNCGTELTETQFDLECDLSNEVRVHREVEHAAVLAKDEPPGLEVEVAESCRTSRSEGKGRGLRTFYGAQVRFTVTCNTDGCEWSVEGTAEEDVQASHMETLV